MKATEIQELLGFIANSGLDEVSLETSDIKLKVKKHTAAKIRQNFIQPSVAAMPADSTGLVAAANPAFSTQETSKTAESEKSAEKDSHLRTVKSPMIGTFYRSPNPDSEPFVQVGDRINAGQAVCIIEAMKLFNEIESEFSGTIVKALTDDASPVEYDQPLFLIDPS